MLNPNENDREDIDAPSYNFDLPYSLEDLRDELGVDFSEYESQYAKWDAKFAEVAYKVSPLLEGVNIEDNEKVREFLEASLPIYEEVFDGMDGIENIPYRLSGVGFYGSIENDKVIASKTSSLTFLGLQHLMYRRFLEEAQARTVKQHLVTKKTPMKPLIEGERGCYIKHTFGIRAETRMRKDYFPKNSDQTILRVKYQTKAVERRYEQAQKRIRIDYTEPQSLYYPANPAIGDKERIAELMDFHLCLPSTMLHEKLFGESLRDGGFIEEWKMWMHCRSHFLTDPTSNVFKAFTRNWKKGLPSELYDHLMNIWKKWIKENAEGICDPQSEAFAIFTIAWGATIPDDLRSTIRSTIQQQGRKNAPDIQKVVKDTVKKVEKKEEKVEEIAEVESIEIDFGVDGIPSDQELKKGGQISLIIRTNGEIPEKLGVTVKAYISHKKNKKNGNFVKLEKCYDSSRLDKGTAEIVLPDFERDHDRIYDIGVGLFDDNGNPVSSEFHHTFTTDKRPRIKVDTPVRKKVTRIIEESRDTDPDGESQEQVQSDEEKEIKVDYNKEVKALIELIISEMSESLGVQKIDDNQLQVTIPTDLVSELIGEPLDTITEDLDGKLEPMLSWTVKLHEGKIVNGRHLPVGVVTKAQNYLQDESDTRIRDFVAPIGLNGSDLEKCTIKPQMINGTGAWNPGGDDEIKKIEETIRGRGYRCYHRRDPDTQILDSITIGAGAEDKSQWMVCINFRANGYTYELNNEAGEPEACLEGVGNVVLHYMLREIGDEALPGRESSEEQKERKKMQKLKKDYKKSIKKNEARLLVGDPILHESQLHIESEVGTDISEVIALLKDEYPSMPINLLLSVGQLRFFKKQSSELGKSGTNIPSQADSDRLYEEIIDSPYKMRNFIERCHSHLFRGESLLYKRDGFRDNAKKAFGEALLAAGIDASKIRPDTEVINEDFIIQHVIPAFKQEGVLVEYLPHITEDPTAIIREFSAKKVS